MQPAIVNVTQPPATTLSFDTVVYLGQSQIRRNIGRSTSLYIGKSVVDRVAELSVNQTLTLTETGPVSALYVQTDSPLTVRLTSTDPVPVVTTIKVSQLLVVDHLSATVEILNETVDTVAKAKISYIYLAPSSDSGLS
jgi:hypothetical protein